MEIGEAGYYVCREKRLGFSDTKREKSRFPSRKKKIISKKKNLKEK